MMWRNKFYTPVAHSPSTHEACCNVDPEQAPAHSLRLTLTQSSPHVDHAPHWDHAPPKYNKSIRFEKIQNFKLLHQASYLVKSNTIWYVKTLSLEDSCKIHCFALLLLTLRVLWCS